LAGVLKVETSDLGSHREITGAIDRVRAGVEAVLEVAREPKTVEVPIFVEREVLVERRVEVPVEVEVERIV
jgi:hypothetical protein